MTGFLFDEPAVGGADAGRAGSFAFKQEGGAVAHLGDGSVNAEVPDRRGDKVVARLKVRGQVKAFVAPVVQVASRGSVSNAVAIDEEDEAVVGADPNHVGGRYGWQIQRAAEMEHEWFAQGRSRVSDPGSLPFMMRWIDRRRGLGKGIEWREREGEDEWDLAHRVRPNGFQEISL